MFSNITPWTPAARNIFASCNACFSICASESPLAGVPGNAPRWIIAMTGLAVEKREVRDDMMEKV